MAYAISLSSINLVNTQIGAIHARLRCGRVCAESPATSEKVRALENPTSRALAHYVDIEVTSFF
jgi:hypothetical protein